MVLQCINGVSSNPFEGRTKIWQLKNLILTLFGLIFRHIYIYMCVCISNFTFILRHKWNNIHVYSRSKPMENKNNNKYSLILNIIFIFLTTYHIKIVQYIQGTITASHIFWLWSIIINYQLSNDLFRKPIRFPTLTVMTSRHDINCIWWTKINI